MHHRFHNTDFMKKRLLATLLGMISLPLSAQAAFTSGPAGGYVLSILNVAQPSNNLLYAGLSNMIEMAGDIEISSDTGRTWTAENISSPAPSVYQMAEDNRGNIFAATSSGLYEQIQGDDSWIFLAQWPQPIPIISMVADQEGNVWLVNAAHALFVWDLKDHLMPVASMQNIQVNSIALASNKIDIIASTKSGLYQFTARGATWAPIFTAPNTEKLAIVTASPSTLYFYGNYNNQGNGVYFVSADGSVTGPLLNGLIVNGFALNPDGGVYAATNVGIYQMNFTKSLNDLTELAALYAPSNTPLQSVAVQTLGKNKTIFALTQGATGGTLEWSNPSNSLVSRQINWPQISNFGFNCPAIETTSLGDLAIYEAALGYWSTTPVIYRMAQQAFLPASVSNNGKYYLLFTDLSGNVDTESLNRNTLTFNSVGIISANSQSAAIEPALLPIFASSINRLASKIDTHGNRYFMNLRDGSIDEQKATDDPATGAWQQIAKSPSGLAGSFFSFDIDAAGRLYENTNQYVATCTPTGNDNCQWRNVNLPLPPTDPYINPSEIITDNHNHVFVFVQEQNSTQTSIFEATLPLQNTSQWTRIGQGFKAFVGAIHPSIDANRGIIANFFNSQRQAQLLNTDLLTITPVSPVFNAALDAVDASGNIYTAPYPNNFLTEYTHALIPVGS